MLLKFHPFQQQRSCGNPPVPWRRYLISSFGVLVVQTIDPQETLIIGSVKKQEDGPKIVVFVGIILIPRASFWMAMLKTLPCFMCFVFQSNWNSHFGAYLWSFWCWKRVLKSKTSICKVLHVFKSFFLEEQKMDPAESSGSFPMKHLKETHNSELVSVKISFGSIKIHDVFHQISGKFPSFLRLGKSQAIQWIQQNPRWASRRWSYQGKCSGRDHLWSNPLRGRPTPQETGLDFRIVVFFFLTNLWDSWLLWKSMKNYLHLRSVVPWDFVGDRRTNCLS